jgi:hypothetical protein
MKILLLFLLLFGLAGCAKPVQRFTPLPDGLALDTKTGRDCRADPHAGNALPLCYDLYKGKD